VTAMGSGEMRMQLVLALPREMASVPVARRTVTAALKAAQVAPECLNEVEVALSEACTNVVRHAGHHHSYEVGISLGDDSLIMDIVDFGEGFGEPAPWWSDMPDITAESGRGMALMRAFTDQADFDSVTGDGVSVHLVKNLRWSSPGKVAANVPGDDRLGSRATSPKGHLPGR